MYEKILWWKKLGDGGWLARSALRAQPPERHFNVVDFEAVFAPGAQRCGSPRIGDVVDPAAVAAHNVLMVITGLELIARSAVWHGDPTVNMGIDQSVKHIVNSLGRDGSQLFAYLGNDCRGIEVGRGVNHRQNRNAGSGYT